MILSHTVHCQRLLSALTNPIATFVEVMVAGGGEVSALSVEFPVLSVGKQALSVEFPVLSVGKQALSVEFPVFVLLSVTISDADFLVSV